ncbi:MAG: GNAT family N-acetyltransferase [Bacteroidaceae bacterium]|nr:GNAT family N-acetyltransferase [Bacteroidaceae bacterium]
MAIKLTSYYRGSHVPELPGNDTFHSSALFHIFEGTPGCNPILLTISEDGVVLGKMLAVVQRIVRFMPFYIMRRCVAYGPGEFFCPDTQREDLFNMMLQEITTYAHRLGCFIIEVRNLPTPVSGFASFKQNHFFPVNWLRVRNTFSDNKEIEQTFSQSRRRQIKRALKNGAKVDTAKNETEIKEFALMLKRNYLSKITKHFPDIEFFQQIEQGIKDVHIGESWQNFKIFIVKYQKKIIGGSICIYSRNTAFVWFSGGMNKTYLHLYPGVMAVWKALTDAQERGFKHLEFMDVGTPFRKHGYRDFVLRFGGEELSTRRWFLFSWKWLNKLCRYFYM